MESDDGVEVFLDAESTSPKAAHILPLNASSRLTAAQRRWRLLKNLTLASKRPTSLTVGEETFLENLSKADSSETHDDTDLLQAREDLKESIQQKASALTKEEVTFLTHLADAPHATTMYLEQSIEVLRKDPLFNKQNEVVIEAEITRPGIETATARKSQTRIGRDASYRTEVWTHFKSEATSPKQEDAPEEKKEEEKNSPPAVPAKKRSYLYKFLFSPRRKGGKANENSSTEDEDITVNDEIEYSILATSARDVACHPHVLSPPMMDTLRLHLPAAVQHDNFWLKYSLVRDGASMRALLQKIRSSSRCMLAIETMNGNVFGAFTSSPWRPHGQRYYGSCEAFLWRMTKSRYTECATVEAQVELEQDLKVFSWSGKNRNIQFLSNADDQLVVGGGAADDDEHDDATTGSGLVIRPDMFHGFSDACVTFECPTLLDDDDDDDNMFEIANLEVWALTPVDNVAAAEKLELGRQFVFDHGNFLQDL